MARSVPIDEMTRRCAYTRQVSEDCAKREGQLARLLISAGLLSTVKPLTRYSPPVSAHVFVIRAGRDALERLDRLMVWSPGWLYSPKKHLSSSTPRHGTTSSRYCPPLSKLDIALSLIPPQPDGNYVDRSEYPVYCHLADPCLRSLITLDVPKQASTRVGASIAAYMPSETMSSLSIQ